MIFFFFFQIEFLFEKLIMNSLTCLPGYRRKTKQRALTPNNSTPKWQDGNYGLVKVTCDNFIAEDVATYTYSKIRPLIILPIRPSNYLIKLQITCSKMLLTLTKIQKGAQFNSNLRTKNLADKERSLLPPPLLCVFP